MKKLFLFLAFTICTLSFVQSDENSFKSGEFLKYRIHYGLLNAGFATLEITEKNYEGVPHFHVVGKGSTSGAVRAFYKVDDRYETYINKTNNKPSKFVRDIYEGGYERDQIITFDHDKKLAKVHDRTKQDVYFKEFDGEVQDLLSALYYLRNYDTDELKVGDYLGLDILMAEETYKFKLKLLGRETIKTRFGRISCLKIRPYVQSGRIFKASESVTMWISDDENLVPIQIKAELAVGSLKADLYEYKNVKSPLKFTKK